MWAGTFLLIIGEKPKVDKPFQPISHKYLRAKKKGFGIYALTYGSFYLKKLRCKKTPA